VLTVPARMIVLGDGSVWNTGYIAAVKDVTSSELSEHIINALFSYNDDWDADSHETQEKEARDEADDLADRTLFTPDERAAQARDGFIRSVRLDMRRHGVNALKRLDNGDLVIEFADGTTRTLGHEQ